MSFRVIIAGGRDFQDYDRLQAACDKILTNKIPEGITVISGTARGADSLGERYAQERGFNLIQMPAEWDLYGKSAGYKRNEAMAKTAGTGGGLIAFWNGKSRGTGHMIDLARQYGLAVRIVRY